MTLLEFPLKRILGRFIPAALPPAGTFHGQTVLITGGTAGLGQAAATHFVRLGADVVITCRNAARGEKARARIEAEAAAAKEKDGENKDKGKGKVAGVLELNMSSYASCVAFVQKLKDWCRENGVKAGPDVIVLNAGRVDPQFSLSPEGWEENIQVNTLSTALLGLLLVAWLREEKRSGNRQTPAHLVFVTSRDHLYPDITNWLDLAAANERGILGHFSDVKNWPPFLEDTEPNYGNSKTLVMHAIQEISKMATSGPEGEVVDVIVNSVCPGLVRTEIGRYIAEHSWYARIIVPIYMAIGGKTAEMGARFYVLGAMKEEKDHGKFIMAWLSDEDYNKKAEANMTGPHARKVHAQVWREMRDDMLAKVPALADALPELKQENRTPV